ncbi:DUF3885 domain-containing protein [Bacillus sp. BRMEA1]|nr:DUF3885 domain-containing protein [Neobacillus endophyticus]
MANKKESLYPIYFQYNEWLGEYDKEKIEGVFNNGYDLVNSQKWTTQFYMFLFNLK